MKTLLIVILVLIVLGLWFYPGLTKSLMLGAASYVKSMAGHAGILK